MFKRTSAVNKIRQLTKRIRIIQGGTSASKTFSILAVLIDYAVKNPHTEISIIAESIPHLRRGAMKDFLKILRWTNRYDESCLNKSLLTYTMKCGSVFDFFSADDSSKLRGARRDILYMNECNNMTFDAYNELSIRTKKHVFLDFNPVNEFWVHSELKDDPNADFIILTYLDNQALDDSIIQQIENNKKKALTSNYWANWWKVYGEGQIGMLEGVVFSNWQTIDLIPTEARLLGIGLDFGYTNDPTSAVAVYKWNDKRILKELFYQTGMLNGDIANALPKDTLIYADSAEPKSIEEIRRRGLQIYPATKGKDSISYGIDLMQQQQYLVTSESTNVIKELRGYCWDVDKTGKQLNKPQGGKDHAIDAIRYHEMESISTNKGVYNIF